MYDSVSLTLPQTQAPHTDYMEEVPCLLTDVAEHYYRTGATITGEYRGLHVSVTPRLIKVGGSLSTYLLGSNVQTIGRRQAQEALESLSDGLHLPMHLSHVGRVDVAATLSTIHPVPSYYPYLGETRFFNRLLTGSTLYYKKKCHTLCFYDKTAEMEAHKQQPPQEFRGCNLFRYERRFIGRVAKSLGVKQVTASTLYDEEFYHRIVDRWKTDYLTIPKVTNVQLIDFSTMKTLKDFKTMAVAKYVEANGGQAAILDQIREAQRRGVLTKKQAQDLRRLIKTASTTLTAYTTPSNHIEELTPKIEETAQKYLSY